MKTKLAVLSLLVIGALAMPASAQTEQIPLAEGQSVIILLPSGEQVEIKNIGAVVQPTETALPPTVAPSETAAPINTATIAPLTATEHVRDTATPATGLQAWEVWHAPGKHTLIDGTESNFHEHGKKPWQWVDDYSMAMFGHPLIFGGDEISSLMEQSHKHQAYENATFTFYNNGCEVQYNLRYHASSTPADRASKVHSFEIYVMDCIGLAAYRAGNFAEAWKHVTFSQGLYWSGDPANQAQRMCHSDQVGGTTTYDGRPSVVRDQYVIISRCEGEDFPTSDTWYVHFPTWDFGLTLLDATTYFHYDEYLNDPMNPTTWVLTGAKEDKLRLEITSLPNPKVSVNFTVPKDAWWCIQKTPTIGTRNFSKRILPFPYWKTTKAVKDQFSCPDGYLPQYNASSVPAIYNGASGGNDIERIPFDWNPLITVPN